MTNPASNERRKVWPLGGYAPGGYSCTCVDCGDQFVGDKRSNQCLDCAIVWANKTITELQSRRQSPAGVEPVAWSYELATHIQGGVTGDKQYTSFEARISLDKPNVPEGSIRNLRPLYTSPPPKAVTITDAMVERAADELVAHGEFSSIPSHNRGNAEIAARAVLTAALSSEAHNG